MSNVKSEYVIDLELHDNSKDAIRDIEKGLKNVGIIAKGAISGDDMAKSLEKAENAADELISKFKEMAKNSALDFDKVVKGYSQSSKKVVSELESQYEQLRQQQSDLVALEDELNQLIKSGASNDKRVEAATKLRKLYENLQIKSSSELEIRIKQNREIRKKLKQTELEVKTEGKYERLQALIAKRKATTDKAEKKALDDKIKQQKAYVKAIELAEKAYKENEKVIKANGKAIQEVIVKTTTFQKTVKAANVISQLTYNTFGRIGGAARTGTAVAKAGIGIARGIGSAISAVASGADQEVERERQANRVKGMSNDDAKSLLRELNVYTGSDYGTIVDAINRVQGTLGRNLQRGELSQAVEMELRYPGISTAFASQSGTNEAGAAGYRQYAAKLNAIQKVTGASADQIAASTQAFANRKDIQSAGGSVSDYQAVYLAMQNSGAFESDDELEQVFTQFVRRQSASGKGVFEFAKDFKIADYVKGDRNKLQAQTADRNMDWAQFATSLKANESKEQGPSDAEKLAIKMREMEDKKNQLLMKLIPAVFPIVEKISDLITSPAGEQIVDGFVNLFKTVLPILDPIFTALGKFLNFMSETILPKFEWLIEKLANFFGKWTGDDDDVIDVGTLPQNANGGIALGPSLVGERGPEAIIPLDYSRAQRAENIAYSIQNNFTMSGNQTTALSLAQAVSSRDFSRAMSKAAFKAGRMGVF